MYASLKQFAGLCDSPFGTDQTLVKGEGGEEVPG
jgi:hypothetical protein